MSTSMYDCIWKYIDELYIWIKHADNLVWTAAHVKSSKTRRNFVHKHA